MPEKGNAKGKRLVETHGRVVQTQAEKSKRAELLIRRRKAFELAAKGASYDQIGDQLGVSGKTAYYDVQHGAAAFDEERRAVAPRYFELAFRSCENSKLKIETLLQQTVDAREVAALVNAKTRVEERLAKLLGLDAAQRVEVSGPDGAPVRVVSYDGTPTEQLLARVEQLREALLQAPPEAVGGPRNADPGAGKGELAGDDPATRYAALVAKRAGAGSTGNGSNGG